MVGEEHERVTLVDEMREENRTKQSTPLHRSAVGSGVSSPAPADPIDDEILRSRMEGEDHVDEEFGNPTRSTMYIFLLTLAIGGLQISWSTEFSNGTVCHS
jgi:solute carrier family 45 protein 1/2/4